MPSIFSLNPPIAMKCRHVAFNLLFSLLAAGLVACVGTPQKPNSVPRVDAGYTHWLEQQSFLGSSGGSGNPAGATSGWGASAPSSVALPPDDTRIWLLIQPQSLITPLGRSVLESLADPEAVFVYEQLGISGLYIDTPISTGAMWQPHRASIEADTDPTGPGLADDMGDAKSWDKLAQTLAARNMTLGTSLLSPVTGTGPDFLLALQNTRQWPMAYGLIDVPREHWGLLPVMAPPEENAPPALMALSLDKEAALRNAGLLPQDMQTNEFSPLRWAVTGEAKAHDGKTRRWIYRMANTPWRPVLHWDDPTATARRMMTGAAQEALSRSGVHMVGMHLRAMEESPEALGSLLRDMSRMSKRRGAALAQRDLLPLPLLKVQQESGADLMLDSVTAPGVEYALLTGDAGPLRAAVDASLALGIDHSRLLRPLTLSNGIDFTLLRGLTASGSSALAIDTDPVSDYRGAWGSVLPMRPGRLQATLPALIAMRAGLAPTPEIMAASGENRNKLLPLHLAVLQFRAGLPGTLEITGQDLMGVLYNPLGLAEYPTLLPESPVSLPGWGPGEHTAPSNVRGVAAGVALYPPLIRQAGEPDSFVATLKRMAQIRKETGLAGGQVVARIPTTTPGVVAVLSRTTTGGHFLTVINLGTSLVDESIVLPPEAGNPKHDAWSGKAISGGTITLRLPPITCRLLYIPGKK